MIRPEELTSNRIYDSCAERYGFDVNANLSTRLKYDLVLKYIRPDHNVLDVGCANGIHMRLLAGKCRQITGIDISQPMLDIAKKTLVEDGFTNATLKPLSATDLEFPDASFDLIYSFSTLLLVPDIQTALREISRVLRPRGIAILDFTGRWNLSRVYWNLYYRQQGHFGVRALGYRNLISRLQSVGFAVVESHALGFLDQWRYIPGLHWCKGLDRLIHSSLQNDFDYRVSNFSFFFPLANRWYLACRKGF